MRYVNLAYLVKSLIALTMPTL